MIKLSRVMLSGFISPYSNKRGIEKFRVCIPDGYGNQIRKQGFLSRQAAEDYITSTLTKQRPIQMGAILNRSMTFERLADEWLKDRKENGCEFQTLHRYESEIRLRLNPFFGRIKLVDLQKDHLRRFIQKQRNTGLSDSTINLSVAQLKQMLKFAEINDYMSNNGIRDLPPPPKKVKEATVWTQSEINYFLNATVKNKNHLLWKVAIYTGMRAGELAALKWDCVYPDHQLGDWKGWIDVRRTWEQKSRSIKEIPKNGYQRRIPMLPEIRDFFANRPQGETFVFGGNQPLESTHFARDLKREIVKYPNLPMITFHELRHSLCSNLESQGYPRRLVSHILGHRDLATTDRYSHVRDENVGFELVRCLRQPNQQNSNNFQTSV